MSNEEEKKCPLCAEEMDWTDQQFRPCQCGYQVCVWCWHHLIDMAEKDETEGRCPACRIPYDKEKIAGTEANCERSGISSSKKHKPPKAKAKTNEGKKDLTSVRVIQRRMAYVIGLPLSLADEDLLQRKEYFGQYGKVTKVSLSRTAGGTVQQFVNDTCSVYITYSKEEEAVRCIQSVHCFALEGRLLRASFGTAKYCHAWLRNMSCTNPGCLYLHNVGAEEDSFCKDELAAVHTRNRVQQIVGVDHSTERRSGSVLPPPVDEPLNNSGYSTENTAISSATKDGSHPTTISSSLLTCPPSSIDRDGALKKHNKTTTFVDIVGRSCSSAPKRDGNVVEDRNILNLSSELSSVNIYKDTLEDEYADAMRSGVYSSGQHFTGLSAEKEAQEYSHEAVRESGSLSVLMRADLIPSDTCVGKEHPSVMLDSGREVPDGSCGNMRQDFVSSDGQRSNCSESDSLSRRDCLVPLAYPVKSSSHYSDFAWQHKETCNPSNIDADRNYLNETSSQFPCQYPVSVDEQKEMQFSHSIESDRKFRYSHSFSDEELVEKLRKLDSDDITTDGDNTALDVVESSIISNILSMDYDACEDSLSLPHKLVGLLEETEGRNGSSWNYNNSNQSRFSFANHDSLVNQVNDDRDSSFCNIDQVSTNFPAQVSPGNQNFLVMPQQQTASRAPQSLAPPGFSVPSRQPPPGFSPCVRKDQVLSSTSGGGHMARNSSSSLFNSQYVSAPAAASSRSVSREDSYEDFVDPAILLIGGGGGRDKSTNGSSFNLGFDTRRPALSTNTLPSRTTSIEEARLWLLMQQQQQQQQSAMRERLAAAVADQEWRSNRSPVGGWTRDEVSPRFLSSDSNNTFGGGVSSRYMDHQHHQTYSNSNNNNNNTSQLSPFITQPPKYGNGGYYHQSSFSSSSNSSEVLQRQHNHNRNEAVDMAAELERGERVAAAYKFFPGYGNQMLQMQNSGGSGGDVFSRVYGM